MSQCRYCVWKAATYYRLLTCWYNILSQPSGWKREGQRVVVFVCMCKEGTDHLTLEGHQESGWRKDVYCLYSLTNVVPIKAYPLLRRLLLTILSTLSVLSLHPGKMLFPSAGGKQKHIWWSHTQHREICLVFIDQPGPMLGEGRGVLGI